MRASWSGWRAGWRKWLLALALITAAAGYAGRAIWLRGLGGFLVRAEAPQTAEMAVVLAGDGFGHRILRAAELAAQGYVKQVVVDGPPGNYDANEAELAIRFAMRRGAPGNIFIPLPIRARSTATEAEEVHAELQRRQVTKALIVTSNYHTRRVRSVYDQFRTGPIQYLVVAARDEDFSPHDWWQSRQGRKVVALEYAKLLNWWLVD